MNGLDIKHELSDLDYEKFKSHYIGEFSSLEKTKWQKGKKVIALKEFFNIKLHEVCTVEKQDEQYENIIFLQNKHADGNGGFIKESFYEPVDLSPDDKVVCIDNKGYEKCLNLNQQYTVQLFESYLVKIDFRLFNHNIFLPLSVFLKSGGVLGKNLDFRPYGKSILEKSFREFQIMKKLTESMYSIHTRVNKNGNVYPITNNSAITPSPINITATGVAWDFEASYNRNPCADKIEKSICPDCKGTGQYIGLNKIEPCSACRKN